MIYYKEADFSGLRKKAGKGRYCDLAAAFDIETTCIKYPDDYDDTKLAGQPKYAFMYIWQFAVGDTAVYGRTWDEFTEFLLDLRGDLGLKDDHKLIVYVHDLSYEFTFMQSVKGLFFGTGEFDFLARSLHDIIKCVVNDVYEFRDSATYTEMPLSSVGALVGIPKLKYDYSKIRLSITTLSDDEMQYCENDVLILTRYFDGQARIYGSYGNIPLTATRCIKREIDANLRQMYYRGVAHKSQIDKTSKDDMYILDLLQSAYFAPWIYNQSAYQDMVVPDVMDADISSAYPYWMLTCQYPKGKFEKVQEDINCTLDEILSRYAGHPMLIKMRLQNLECLYPRTAWVPTNDEYWYVQDPDVYDRRIKKCKAIHLTLTDVDVRTLKQFYKWDAEIIDEVYIAKKYGFLSPYVIKTIIDKYIDKRNAKDKKKEIEKNRELTAAEAAEYTRIKSRVDRIYGIFVQKPVRTSYRWNPNSGQVESGEKIYVKSDSDCAVDFAWGVWLLSYERREMLKIFAACNLADTDGKRKNLDIVLYGDTDSLKFRCGDKAEFITTMDIITQYNTNCKTQIEKFWRRNKDICDLSDIMGMGEFHFKHYQLFKACKIKRYAYVTDLNEFVAVCAGLSPDNTYFDDCKTVEEKMEKFTGDMQIPANIANGKRTQYVYTTYEDDLVDCYGNSGRVKVSSCVLIGKTSFNYASDADHLTVDDWHNAWDRKPTYRRKQRR